MNCFFSILLFLIAISNVHAQTKAGYNCWEFLEWGTDSATVSSLVKKKGREIRYPNALNARFRYQDLNTWLDYDSTKKLQTVKQRIAFSAHEQKQANETYEKIRTRMLTDYGRPRIEMRDTLECNTHIYWDLKHTKIHLEYDYQYKIIDEFGAGSYWVEIIFEKAD
ncbi:MAG TPA: hypothetical protein VK177_08570 [Flavobacteriales bacterium]|nr:hypothetical protein [Flavobacteriales bacterium]